MLELIELLRDVVSSDGIDLLPQTLYQSSFARTCIGESRFQYPRGNKARIKDQEKMRYNPVRNLVR